MFGQEFDSDRYWTVIEKASLLPDLQVLPDGDLTEVGDVKLIFRFIVINCCLNLTRLGRKVLI